MKRILITGENSYIGTSFAEYMEQFKDDYLVETISVRGDEWKNKDFSIYDVVYHVAGIAHRKETPKNKELYFDVNYELTKLVAEKAKNDGVKQFVFLSSMSVYGLNEGIIDSYTEIKPTSYYGKSKYEAEQYLSSLKGINFRIAIVRPPMVYGKNCKGNYQKLKRLSVKLKLFPKIENKRSMIFIDNLSMYIYFIVKNDFCGSFNVQNKELVNTNELIKYIALSNGKKVYFSKILLLMLKIIKIVSPKVKLFYTKAFGTLYFEKEKSKLDILLEQHLIDFETTIKFSEE